jgi:hypothetical protein
MAAKTKLTKSPSVSRSRWTDLLARNVFQGLELFPALGITGPFQQVKLRWRIRLKAQDNPEKLLPCSILIQNERPHRGISLRRHVSHKQFSQPSVASKSRINVRRPKKSQNGLPKVVCDGSTLCTASQHIRAQVTLVT